MLGYILPIVQHTYSNYHYRTIKARYNHHHIEKPFKVILEDQYELINQKYKTHNTKMTTPSLRWSSSPQVGLSHDSSVKGKFIDEVV